MDKNANSEASEYIKFVDIKESEKIHSVHIKFRPIFIDLNGMKKLINTIPFQSKLKEDPTAWMKYYYSSNEIQQ